MPRAAILDVDGTLVDTNYQHALAWFRAFREQGIVVPIWRLHRHVGMGGDKFVSAVAGEDVEERLGETLRERWEALFDEVIDEVEPLAGARELIADLKERGLSVVLASSAVEKHVEAFVDKLGTRELADGWTTKDDVEASKPDPDLVRAALDKAGTDDAVMLGDTPWDVEAARRCGLETIALVTGGYSEQELREAGAVAVFESIDDLRERVGETPLGRS
ncbi:MAG: HAD family hydrolase [Actinomycetota bacterium]|nr:HAD family hydrolase [Actinomycetota bacterium]